MNYRSAFKLKSNQKPVKFVLHNIRTVYIK